MSVLYLLMQSDSSPSPPSLFVQVLLSGFCVRIVVRVLWLTYIERGLAGMAGL